MMPIVLLKKLQTKKRHFSVILLLCKSYFPSFADHPIEIESLLKEGDYYEASLKGQTLPHNLHTINSKFRYGESLWRLSLHEKAKAVYRSIIEAKESSARDRILGLKILSVIALQEPTKSNLKESREAALLLLQEVAKEQESHSMKGSDKSPFNYERGVGEYILGLVASRSNEFLLCTEHFARAIQAFSIDNEGEDKPLSSDARFYQAECYEKLGLLKEAQKSLEGITLGSDQSLKAMLRLARLSLQERNYNDLFFWIEKYRDLLPPGSIDGEISYLKVMALLGTKRFQEAIEVAKECTNTLPPSNPWLVQIEAEILLYKGQERS
jgi:tetratricopeptide (TPR) repeat protein